MNINHSNKCHTLSIANYADFRRLLRYTRISKSCPCIQLQFCVDDKVVPYALKIYLPSGKKSNISKLNGTETEFKSFESQQYHRNVEMLKSA
jgi:hypothetical protein